MSNDILKSSKQLAVECGINPDQLRQLKHKNGDRFVEGTHFIKDDSGNLWTVAGEIVVKELLGNNDPVATNNDPVAAINLSRYDALAEVLGEQIATQLKAGDFWTKVDKAVVRSLLSTLPKLPNFTVVCSEFFVEPHALTGFVTASLASSEDKTT